MNASAALSDFTCPGLVCSSLRATDPASAIRELAELVGRSGKVADAREVERLALERERLSPTDCEDGLAMPHARVPGIQSLLFAAGRSASGIPWGPHKLRVRIVFLLVVPENHVGAYLQLISGVARLSRERELLSALFEVPDEASLMAVLGRVPLRSPPAAPRTRESRSVSP
jgi:PTS system fructose-specific IIC component